jgi:hypothetical protein
MDYLEMTRDALRELEQLARESHADAIADEAGALAERAAEGRFYVACVAGHRRAQHVDAAHPLRPADALRLGEA